MSLLTPRERDLVSLGAALGRNCIPCIEHHIPASRSCGRFQPAERSRRRLRCPNLRRQPRSTSLAADSG